MHITVHYFRVTSPNYEGQIAEQLKRTEAPSYMISCQGNLTIELVSLGSMGLRCGAGIFGGRGLGFSQQVQYRLIFCIHCRGADRCNHIRTTDLTEDRSKSSLLFSNKTSNNEPESSGN